VPGVAGLGGRSDGRESRTLTETEGQWVPRARVNLSVPSPLFAAAATDFHRRQEYGVISIICICTSVGFVFSSDGVLIKLAALQLSMSPSRHRTEG
jgi:hypothetical protein